MRLNLAILAALLPVNLVFAAGNPVLQGDLLTIPHIDTAEQAGHYRHATFKWEKDNTWILSGMTETQLATVEKVEVIKTLSRPVQVFLKVSGYLPTPCDQLEQAGQRYEPVFGIPEANLPVGRFEVALGIVPLQTFAVCAQVIEPFEHIMPLPVYGLSRGTYQFEVNGVEGSFHLNADNNLPSGYGLKDTLIPKIGSIIDPPVHILVNN